MDLLCNFCLENFDDGEKAPRMLPCGHTACTKCAIPMLANKCTICHMKIPFHSIDNLILNLDKLELVMSNQNILKCKHHQDQVTCMCIECKEWACNKCFNTQHIEQPKGNCSFVSVEVGLDLTKSKFSNHILKYKEILKGTLNQHKCEVKKIDKDIISLISKKESFENYITECEDQIKLLDDWTYKIVQTPALNIDKTLVEANEVVANCDAWFKEHCPDPLSEFRKQLEFGWKTYAEIVENNKKSWSLLKKVNEEILMYSSQDSRPGDGQIISYTDVVLKVCQEDQRLCFIILDLNDNSCSDDRLIVVKLINQGPSAQELFKICQGSDSRSLRKVPCKVRGKGRPWEELYIPGHHHNGKLVNTPIVKGLQEESDISSDTPMRRAMVGGWKDDSRFRIIARDDPGRFLLGYIGDVVRGLDVVDEAVRLLPDATVTIAECGVILPLK